MTTIAASTTLGLALDPASYTAPVVIGAGVTVTNNDGDAITISGAAYYFAIQNVGTISGAGTYLGIYLLPGGSITNAASGSIAGYSAIEITGGVGIVANAGNILG